MSSQEPTKNLINLTFLMTVLVKENLSESLFRLRITSRRSERVKTNRETVHTAVTDRLLVTHIKTILILVFVVCYQHTKMSALSNSSFALGILIGLATSVAIGAMVLKKNSKQSKNNSNSTSYDQLIGNTPLIKLKKLSLMTGCDIYVKVRVRCSSLITLKSSEFELRWNP